MILGMRSVVEMEEPRMANKPVAEASARPQKTGRDPFLARVIASLVFLFEKMAPDPFVFAVILTVLTAVFAYTLVGTSSVRDIGSAWYISVFAILPVAFQMAMGLVTCYSLASSTRLQRILDNIS